MPRSSRKRPPAIDPEQRESQMVSLAVDLAEKQLLDGTATSQVITHYLKLGTARESLEREKIKHENDLLVAKKENLETAKRIEELYIQAMEAMKSYRGDQ